MAYGKLHVYDDPTVWAKKIVYSALNMTVAHAISEELLDKLPIDLAIKSMAKQMAYHFEKDIEELLLAQFKGELKKSQGPSVNQ